MGKRDDISEFGTIIAELLLLSLHDVPPPQFGMLDREPGAVKLAELLGVKKELGRNVRILSIEDDGSDITFTPTRNEGRGGFVRMESVRSMVPHESPAAFIGSAAISALDSAEFFSEESS